MESLQLPTSQKSYNWDDIDVGNVSVNNSQNFFAIPHIKHEKFDDLELIQNKMADAELNESFGKFKNGFDDNDKENITENNKTLTPSKIKKEDLLSPIKDYSPVTVTEVPVAESTEVSTEKNAEKNLIKEKPAVPNIIPCCWSTQKQIVSKKIIKHGNGAVPKNAAALQRTPEAYHFKDVYHNKKQEAERKRAAEERKMREFHCRPVPNFRAMHERLKKHVVVHKISAPITPKTLKISLQLRQKKELMRKKLLEEEAAAAAIKKKEEDVKDTKVIFKDPFVPKKANNILQPRPFHLQSAKRAEERKQFDAQVQQALEEKRKKEEEERKRQEEEEIRELKKLATFKARPNPFK